MIKWLRCLFWGHEWKLIKKTVERTFEFDHSIRPCLIETCFLLGCERCKKMKLKKYPISGND